MTFSKKKYWENRKAKKRGQDEVVPAIVMPNVTIADNTQMGFDNEGQIILKNRAYRRQKIKLPNDEQKKKVIRKYHKGKKNMAGKGFGRK